jgi:hypothetical protein
MNIDEWRSLAPQPPLWLAVGQLTPKVFFFTSPIQLYKSYTFVSSTTDLLLQAEFSLYTYL